MIAMPRNRPQTGGIKCCCCRCCVCLHLEFLTTKQGIIKLLEAILGGICQGLLVNYGLSQAGVMGQAFHGFLTTASACLLTTSILLACYVLSNKTHQLMRQSLFQKGSIVITKKSGRGLFSCINFRFLVASYASMETVFNGVACFLYLSASSCLGFAVNVFLYPIYLIQPGYSAYPAMTAVYYIGCILGITHGYDAYNSYSFLKGHI